MRIYYLFSLWEQTLMACTIWVTFFSALSGIITYLVTVHVNNLNSVEARRDADREKTWREAQDAFLNDLHTEQQVSTSVEREKLILKKTYLNIHERLLYKHLPITSWVDHKRLLMEEVDHETLIKTAQAASMLIGVPEPGRISARIVPRLLKK